MIKEGWKTFLMLQNSDFCKDFDLNFNLNKIMSYLTYKNKIILRAIYFLNFI